MTNPAIGGGLPDSLSVSQDEPEPLNPRNTYNPLPPAPLSETAGWRLVPERITNEMACELERCFAETLPPCDTHRLNWQKAWRNALDAAPLPEALEEGASSVAESTGEGLRPFAPESSRQSEGGGS